MFPFGSLADDEFLVLLSVDLPSFVNSIPSFEITSDLLDLPSLIVYDIDRNMPQIIDSHYCTIPKRSSLQVSSTDFSILRTNIRSLSLHYNELVSLLVRTNLNLEVIGVLEIRHSTVNPIVSNIDISGYTFWKLEQSLQMVVLVCRSKIILYLILEMT